MVEWVKVGTNVVVGGAVGAVDQLLQNWDEKREVEAVLAGKKLGVMAQYGTYYNYGIPILAIIGTAMGWLRGDWSTRLVTVGSALAGRKITSQVTKKEAASYTQWSRSRQAEATRQKQLAARTQVGGPVSPVGIPIVADEAILV